MIVAVDTMGGDFAPNAQIDAGLLAIKDFDVDIIFLGDETTISNYLKDKNFDKTKVEIVHCSENITNDDKPVMAIKRKKQSPMVIGCDLLNTGKADALVSSGNTGALMTSGMLLTGRITGLQRPALTCVFPTLKSPTVLLDVGANAQCKPEHINDFGFMGYAYAKAVLNLENPKVGLINIGTEETKGSQTYIDAHKMLKENKSINFVGNIEARDIPNGHTDVLVCDGFTGNVVLKLTEGVASSLFQLIKKAIKSSFKSSVGGMLIKSSLKDVKKSLDYEEHGGAILLGINQIVIKAHGSSNSKAFKNAIRQAKLVYDSKLIDSFKEFAKNNIKQEDDTDK